VPSFLLRKKREAWLFLLFVLIKKFFAKESEKFFLKKIS
jgi:hypothetical protein